MEASIARQIDDRIAQEDAEAVQARLRREIRAARAKVGESSVDVGLDGNNSFMGHFH